MQNDALKSAPHNFPGKWFHCISTTYGSWLYGDARGYRTRHHREHVDGDYKNPPPPEADIDKRLKSIQSLKQPVVQIPRVWRKPIGISIRDKLVERGGFVLSLAACAQHVHVLVKLPRKAKPRMWMGVARKNATFEAKDNGWEGKLWGRRGKEIAIRDRRHQLNVYRYILAHTKEGAWVWDWMKERDKEK